MIKLIFWRASIAFLQLAAIYFLLEHVSESDLAAYYYTMSVVVLVFVLISSFIDYKCNIGVSNRQLKRADFIALLLIFFPFGLLAIFIGFYTGSLSFAVFAWLLFMILNQVVKNYINILGFSNQTVTSMFVENAAKIVLIALIIVPSGGTALDIFLILGAGLSLSIVYLVSIVFKRSIISTSGIKHSLLRFLYLLKDRPIENVDVTVSSLMNALYVNLPRIVLGWLGEEKILVVLGAFQSVFGAAVGVFSSFLKIEFTIKIFKNHRYIYPSIIAGLISLLVGIIGLYSVEMVAIQFLPSLVKDNYHLSYFAFMSEFYIVFLSILCTIFSSVRETKKIMSLHIFLLFISACVSLPIVVFTQLYYYFMFGSVITGVFVIYLMRLKRKYEFL